MPKLKHSAPYIIFTDLDGTLLDHETYSYAAADKALKLVHETKTPLILASSKTAAEIAPLRSKLGFDHCAAIVENGSGILAANEMPNDKTGDYPQITKLISTAPANLRKLYKGFSDWSANEIAQITSLDLPSAKLAKQRQFSEPGLWSGSDTDKAHFTEYLAKHGLRAQQGGRFLTISFGASKADSMKEILIFYRLDRPNLTSVALGDAPNDKEMLETADLGFIIRNHMNSGIFPSRTPEHIYDSEQEGPKGWNQCIISLFS